MKKKSLKLHPCFGLALPHTTGRIHLPVAPKCNIQCAFCDRRYDCINESRPGVTSRILTPKEAVKHAINAITKQPAIHVAGIAGPGDALANEEAFETAKLIRQHLPCTLLCMSTNGLAAAKYKSELAEVAPDSMTITINAVNVSTAKKIYTKVCWDNETLYDKEAAVCLLEHQRYALCLFRDLNIPVKVNTVLIPGINDTEIEAIAIMAKKYEAEIMNIIPLIPCGEFKHIRAPEHSELIDARLKSSIHVRQLTTCIRCRADACGII